jgi:hypothetical protein
VSHRACRTILLTLVALVACSAAVLAEVAPDPEGLQVDVDLAPNVLNIQSKGEVVTVHTDIDFLLVDAPNVFLNGVLIYSWKADDRGDFVAKFWMDEVKDLPLVLDSHNTLLLTGQTRSQQPFWGAQDILVVSKGAQSR